MIRIMYALGPGDVLAAYEDLKQGREVIAETSRTFSGQFFEFCREQGHAAYAISRHPVGRRMTDGAFIIENRPKLLAAPRGLLYHLNEAAYALSLFATAVRYRPHVLIVDSGTTHWFMLMIFAVLRIPVVGSLHNMLWAKADEHPGRLKRWIRRADGVFWRRTAAAAICVSPRCQQQLEQLTRGRLCPVFQYRAQFDPLDFQDIKPPQPHQRPFRVLFVGRIERNKGAFDLLEVAEYFQQRMPGQVTLDLCGGGSSLEEMREQVQQRMLTSVQLHGKLNRPELLKMYEQSHVVIVPTRSDFAEALAMVAAEATLCGRPVLCSSVVPALDLLRPAAIECRVDDPRSFCESLARLMEDPDAYEKARSACAAVSQVFIDPAHGMPRAIDQALRSALSEQMPAAQESDDAASAART